ncbi:MAG: hypothetical protein LBE56_12045 [Tannerella sp.]|nr:hypothetical protein [Tannerella sp.]
MGILGKTMYERIEKFNKAALRLDFSQLPTGLYHGKMGLCVYFYELADLISEEKYRFIAEKLFDDIVTQIAETVKIDPPEGLTGICMAVNFLINSGYINGNPNHVLKDFDNKILKSLLFLYIPEFNPDIDRLQKVLGSLSYLTVRLQNTRLTKNERDIMKGVIIEIINKFESLNIDKFTEPAHFSITEYFISHYLQLLQRIYRLDFYNYKIEKIIDGFSFRLLSLYPMYQANRLSLSSLMQELNTLLGGITGWDRHIELLQQNIDVSWIINDFRNKDMSFERGLCGFYFLLRKIGLNRKYQDQFIHKIEISDNWNHYLELDNDYIHTFSLYSGAPGVILTYLHLLNRGNALSFFDSVIGQYC